MSTAALVAVGGGIGAIARFRLDGFVTRRWAGPYALGTLVVNLSGCFLLGLIVGLHASPHLKLLVGTATLGSYTTFSTWMFEAYRAAKSGQRRPAWLSVVGGLGLGFGLILLGRAIGGL